MKRGYLIDSGLVQLELNPLAYIADNESFSFVTQDALLYEQVLLAVQKVELEIGTACDARSTLADS